MEMSASIWPLPGGIEHYEQTLRHLIALCSGPTPVDAYVEAVMEAYPRVSSPRTVRSYIYNVLGVLGFAEINRGTIVATSPGQAYSESGDRRLLESALRTRLTGVAELLEELEREPRPIGQLLEAMQCRGFEWTSDWQLRYRLRWLRVAGVVERRTERDSRGRYPDWALASQHGP